MNFIYNAVLATMINKGEELSFLFLGIDLVSERLQTPPRW